MQRWLLAALAVVPGVGQADPKPGPYTLTAVFRDGSYHDGGDDLHVYGGAVEGEDTIASHVALRAAIAVDSVKFVDDLGTNYTGYQTLAVLGMRFDAIARDSATPLRAFFAFGLGIGIRHTEDANEIPPTSTFVDPYIQLAQLGLEILVGGTVVRATYGVEGLDKHGADTAAFTWTLGVGRRF